jgi:hypothetical protein
MIMIVLFVTWLVSFAIVYCDFERCPLFSFVVVDDEYGCPVWVEIVVYSERR